jgi:hypothetical protein
LKKVALPVALCGVGGAVMLAAPPASADDALTAMTITIAVCVVLAVIGMLALLIHRVNQERISVRPRELPPVKVIRVTAERVDNPRKGIAKARLPLGERGTNER